MMKTRIIRRKKRKIAHLCVPKTVETMRTPVLVGDSIFAPQMALLIKASVQMDFTGTMKKSKSFLHTVKPPNCGFYLIKGGY